MVFLTTKFAVSQKEVESKKLLIDCGWLKNVSLFKKVSKLFLFFLIQLLFGQDVAGRMKSA